MNLFEQLAGDHGKVARLLGEMERARSAAERKRRGRRVPAVPFPEKLGAGGDGVFVRGGGELRVRERALLFRNDASRNLLSPGELVESSLSYFQSGAGAEYARSPDRALMDRPSGRGGGGCRFHIT